MTELPIIAVMSATGTQGKAVTSALSASGRFAIRALTRDTTAEKAKSIATLQNVTMFNSTNDLDEAFKGASGVFGYSFTGPGESEYMKEIIDKADKAGVDVFIYSSLPSANEDSNGRYSEALHFERKQEVEKHLKTVKMKSIIVHLAPFVENFLNFYGITKDGGDKLNIVLNAANLDTKLPMIMIDPDLGEAARLMFETYKDTQSLFESPIPVTSYRMPYGDHSKILREVTGREVNEIIMSTFGTLDNLEVEPDTNLEQMREYYDNVGLFKDHDLPDPRLNSIGYEPHDFEYYVRKFVVPALDS